MTLSPRAIEAAVKAMKAIEDEATADPEKIFGADLTSLAKAAITAYLAALAVDGASSLRNFVLSHWDNQDMNHADFRVRAYQIAAASTGDSTRKTEG